MATEILASGNTAASTADRTVVSGDIETLIFRSSAGNSSQCTIEAKASDGIYYEIGTLGSSGRVKQVSGPITYRVRRSVGNGDSAIDVEI